MAQQGPVNPPDGWGVDSGFAWGVDVVQDNAQVLASPTSVKIPALIGRNPVFRGPLVPINNFSASPNGSGMRYRGRCFLYADSNSAFLTVQINWLASDRVTVNSTTTLFSSNPITLNAWITGSNLHQTSSTDKWAQFVVTVNSGGANVWLGGVELTRMPAFFQVTQTTFNVTGGTNTYIPWSKTQAYWNFAAGITAEVNIGTPGFGGAVANSGLFLQNQGQWHLNLLCTIPSNMANNTVITLALVDNTGSVIAGPFVFPIIRALLGPVANTLILPIIIDISGYASAPTGVPIAVRISHNDGANVRTFTNAVFTGTVNA